MIISRNDYRKIELHGIEQYPHECCGFLLGTVVNGVHGIRKIVRAANTRLDRPENRFEIDPGELMRTDRSARSEGMSVTGFYHSHPDAPARPSKFDREHAWPGYCYVIVSIEQSLPTSMQNWVLREDRTGYEEDPIIIEEKLNDAG